jgi:tryptophan-rich sensory protein
MVKNFYYLVVGLLCVLFAFTHAWNGQTTILPLLENTNLNTDTKAIFHYVWHIISVENLIFGIALVYMAFYKDLTKVKIIAYLIALLLVFRWMVIFGFTLFYDKNAISHILTDTIAILIVVVLLFLGTRVKARIHNA